MIGLRVHAARGTGTGAPIHLHAGAFLKTRGELDRPDIQLHFVNALMRDHGRVKADATASPSTPARSESRGTVQLASRNPFDSPAIELRATSRSPTITSSNGGVKQAGTVPRPQLASVDREAVAIRLDARMIAHQRVDEVQLDVGAIEFAARLQERAGVQMVGAPVALAW